MKILFFLHLPPPFHGVTYINSIIQSSEKVNNRFDTSFFNLCISSKAEDVDKIDLSKFIVGIVHFLKGVFKLLFHKYDLLYISLTPAGLTFFRDAIFVILASARGKRIAIHIHGKGVKKLEVKFLWRYFYRIVFKKVIPILLSEKLYFDIETFKNKSDCFFLNNTISSFEFKSQFSPQDPISLSYISHLRPLKGVNDLVEVVNVLVNDFNLKNIKIDVIGKFVDEAYQTQIMNEIANKNLIGNFIFHGPLYGEDKMRVLSKKSVFIYPTLEEAWGLVILEAMQCGLPVVAYNEGAISDMVINSQNGYVCSKGDKIEMAARVNEIISTPDLYESYSAQSLNYFKHKFTTEEFEKNLINILNAIENIK